MLDFSHLSLPTFFSLPCAEGGLTHKHCKLSCPLVPIWFWLNGKSENGKEMQLGYLFPLRTLQLGYFGLAALLSKGYSSCQVALTIKPPSVGSSNHAFSLPHPWIGESSPLLQAQSSVIFLFDFLKLCPHICTLPFNLTFLKMPRLTIPSVSCQDSNWSKNPIFFANISEKCRLNL